MQHDRRFATRFSQRAGAYGHALAAGYAHNHRLSGEEAHRSEIQARLDLGQISAIDHPAVGGNCTERVGVVPPRGTVFAGHGLPFRSGLSGGRDASERLKTGRRAGASGVHPAPVGRGDRFQGPRGRGADHGLLLACCMVHRAAYGVRGPARWRKQPARVVSISAGAHVPHPSGRHGDFLYDLQRLGGQNEDSALLPAADDKVRLGLVAFEDH